MAMLNCELVFCNDLWYYASVHTYLAAHFGRLFYCLKRATMTRDELLEIVKQSKADTLIACRMRAALGLRPFRHRSQRGRTRDKSAKQRKYRGAKRLMKQKHGVRL